MARNLVIAAIMEFDAAFAVRGLNPPEQVNNLIDQAAALAAAA